MTEAQYYLFLSVGAWICALAAAANLLNLKRRGNTAIILSAAFLAMGGILLLVKSHASQGMLNLAGLVLAGLLVTDVVIRARQQGKPQ